MEVALLGTSASPGTGATTMPGAGAGGAPRLAPIPPGSSTRQDGIDVYVGNTNLPAMAALQQAGFSYLIHKSSERTDNGSLITDTAFVSRWRDAGNAHLVRGSFHFYRHLDGATDDPVKTVVGQIGRLVPGDLAPALDFEGKDRVLHPPSPTAPSHEPTASEWRVELEAFLDGLEKALGRTPIIYTGWYAWTEHITGKADYVAADYAHFADYPLWLKEYHGPRFVTLDDIDHPTHPPTQVTVNLDSGPPAALQHTWEEAAATRADGFYNSRGTACPRSRVLGRASPSSSTAPTLRVHCSRPAGHPGARPAVPSPTPKSTST